MAASQSKLSCPQREHRDKLTHTCHQLGHTWTPSCAKCFVELFVNGYIYALKLYGPLYLISGIISKLRTGRIRYWDIAQGCAQSSLFLAVNCACMVTSFCCLRRVRGYFTSSSGSYLPGIMCSIAAVSCERKERRGLLALYTTNVALDSLHRQLKDKGYPVSIKHGEVMIMCAASAILIFLSNKKALTHGFIAEFLKIFYLSPTPEQGITFIQRSLLWLKALGKAGLTGYLLQAGPNVLFSMKSLLQKPGTIYRCLLKRANFDLALFLGSSVGIFQVMSYVLSTLFSVKQSSASVIAASISGVSMLAYPSPAISMYAFLKGMESLYMYVAKFGYLPTFKHGDTIMYGLSCGYVLGKLLTEPHTVSHKYFQFVTLLTNYRMYDINRADLDRLGFNGSWYIEKLKEDIMNGKMSR